MLNAHWEPLDFEMPRVGSQRPYRWWIDTYRDAPDDVCDWNFAPAVQTSTYAVQPLSLVTLVAESGGRPTGGRGDS